MMGVFGVVGLLEHSYWSIKGLQVRNVHVTKKKGSTPTPVICDIETESLNPKIIHVIVCKDTTTKEVRVFREPQKNPQEFLDYAKTVNSWVFHGGINFDVDVINDLLGTCIHVNTVIDTVVISRLLNTDIAGGHGLDAWGQRLGVLKTFFNDYSKLTEEMVQYCIQDVLVTEALYNKFLPWIQSENWRQSLRLEHNSAIICKEIHTNGFTFDRERAIILLNKIQTELKHIDDSLHRSFPPRAYAIREITPKLTKGGTLSLSDFRFLARPVVSGQQEREGVDLSAYSANEPFTLIGYEPFNPGSPSQIVERLNEAGWKPTEKTKGHIKAERERDTEKLKRYKVYGWKVSEDNLSTLPETAPQAIQGLRRRIILDSRRSSLEEWISLYQPSTGRIHGDFFHIGAWTHRMSHSGPNMANVPAILDKFGRPSIYGREIRQLWTVPEGSWLIGVDADGIQSRVLAHYLAEYGDYKLRDILESGESIHNQNVIALGEACRSRESAKRFYYAWLLGAGIGQVASILQCKPGAAKRSMSSFKSFYPGLSYMDERYSVDASRGYFVGLDGRKVLCPDAHHMKAGYLQTGETVIMKTANQIFKDKLNELYPNTWKQINFVHDEYEVEFKGSRKDAEVVAKVIEDSIREAGVALGLNCALKGNSKIGRTWADCH